MLYRALRAGAASVMAGEDDPAAVAELVRSIIEAEPLAEVDSVDLVDPGRSLPPGAVQGELRLLVAARFGRARLIDNLALYPNR